jgi:hypothetical protein
MNHPGAESFRLTVLNPVGRDPEQNFRDPSGPGTSAHPPVNFHAFAACTNGIFQHDTQRAIADELPVLLLLRGDFRASERAFKELRRNGRKIAVSLKETGMHQIAEQVRNPWRLARLLRMVEHAEGCIATTPEAAEVYWRARLHRDPATVAFIPTPYPLEDKQWNLSVPPNEQSGIFIGTREWNVPSRNHFGALLVARQLCEASGERITVVNLDGWFGRRRLTRLGFPAGKLNLIEKKMPYADYLREMGRHKIVLQLDRSRVPGQVAGDALMARTICVGGDGAIDRIVFSKTCGEGRTMNDLTKIASGLLTNTNGRATLILESQWRAMERLSFEAIRSQLAEFFGRL